MKTIEDIINETTVSASDKSIWNIYTVGGNHDLDFDVADKDCYVVINVGPDHPEVVFTYDPSDFDDSIHHMSVGSSRKLDTNGNYGVIYRFR